MIRYFCILILLLATAELDAQIYNTNSGTINFISEAPLEIIKAESADLKGVLDLEHKTFAFKLFIKSFKGFNSPLQQEHFYENYLEVKKYPESVFKGKIIESIDLENPKSYRAKGLLSIHGVSKEVIITVDIIPSQDQLSFQSKFKVELKDYKIELPRIVYQKIAETIEIEVSGKLKLN